MGNSGNVYHNQYGNNYEGKVDQAVFDARGDYFSQQTNNASYNQMVMSNIMPVAQSGGDDYYENGIRGVALSTMTAFGKGNYHTGSSIALLSDGESYALALTKYSNPRKNPIGASITFSHIKITSNDGHRVKFSDLLGAGEEYNIGALVFEYGIAGAPKVRRSKASSYKMQSFGISVGFPVSHGEFDSFTWIIPLW